MIYLDSQLGKEITDKTDTEKRKWQKPVPDFHKRSNFQNSYLSNLNSLLYHTILSVGLRANTDIH